MSFSQEHSIALNTLFGAVTSQNDSFAMVSAVSGDPASSVFLENRQRATHRANTRCCIPI